MGNNALAKLPPLPGLEQQQAWNQLCQDMPDSKGRQGAYFLLVGHSYRTAAGLVEINWSDLHRYATRNNLRPVVNNTDRAMANWKEADVLFSEAAAARASDPEQLTTMSTLQVTTAGAISRDKVAASERQDGVGDSNRLSPLEQLAKAALEGKLDMEIRVRPASEYPDALRQGESLQQETAACDED